MELNRVQPKKQILTEPSLRDFLCQVGIRRRQNAHVRPFRFRRADALELSRFQNAQKFPLLAIGDVRDFVEKERAAIGELEAPDTVGLSVGIGAFHMTKELALENTFGQPADVHGDHRPTAARGHRVQRPGHNALSRAVLARDEHVRVRRPDSVDELEDLLHRRRFGHELRRVLPKQLVLALEALATTKCAAELDLRSQDAEKTRVVPRLLYEIARAAAHRFHGELDAPPRGHDDDGKRLIDIFQPFE